MNKKIVVVGSLNMDVVVRVDSLPRLGETIIGHSLSYIPGGKGANQAVAAGKLGGNITMLGRIGNDPFGNTLIKNLADGGVDVSHIERSELPTGTAMINVDRNGDNTIVVSAGANGACDISYLERHKQVLETADIIISQMEIPHETVYYLAEQAKKMNKTIILDPAPAPLDFPEDIYNCLTYITPNETELQILSGMDTGDDISAAERLLDKGAERVLVTCGAEGAKLVTKNGCDTFPVEKVPVVDSTAAGDAFNAAFAVALTEGKTEHEAIRFANRVATLVVMGEGAQNSLPKREDLNK